MHQSHSYPNPQFFNPLSKFFKFLFMYHTIPRDRNVHNYTFVLLLAHYDNVRSSCFNNFIILDVYIPKWLHFIIFHNTFCYMFIALFSFLWSWCNSHNFHCIILSALSCRLLHSFGAKFLYSVTRWPTLSPFSPHTLQVVWWRNLEDWEEKF